MLKSSKRQERRKGPDFLIKVLKNLVFISWVIIFTSMVLLDLAKPQMESFFDKLFGVHRNTNWNYTFMDYMFYTMVCGLGVSVGGLYINSKRMRRKGDHYSISLIFLGLVSTIGIIFYLVRIF